jgi:hypothetical protein
MIPAVLTHCAGIDIGKRDLAVCVMVGPADAEPKMEVREFSTFTADLEVMKTWLLQAGCTHVVMESTGPYWKPVFNVLEGSLVVCLANCRGCQRSEGAQDRSGGCPVAGSLTTARHDPNEFRSSPSHSGVARSHAASQAAIERCH